MTDPIEINGETFAPVLVECPAEECDATIDAQRVLYQHKECPTCRTPIETLIDGYRGEGPGEDYEPESYKVQA